MRAIETINLTKEFNRGKLKALDDVSLTVNTGHVFGLLGPNGAGKTTLIKILLGILYPTSGSVALMEQPVNTIRVKEKIGYLPENHRYPDFLRGGEVLTYYGRLAGLNRKAINRKKEQLLKLVNMEKWENTKLRKYSKGMLQRLGLAQAMINDPELLFLDEPTDGVDPIGRKKIRDILRRLQEEGKTIFLNSHLLSEVEMTCDEVAILDNGKLIRSGTVQELTSPSRTFRFETSTIGDNMVAALRQMALNLAVENGALHVTCADQQTLNKIIDYLRQHDVDIRSIVPHKQSLEESFIEILKKDIIH